MTTVPLQSISLMESFFQFNVRVKFRTSARLKSLSVLWNLGVIGIRMACAQLFPENFTATSNGRLWFRAGVREDTKIARKQSMLLFSSTAHVDQLNLPLSPLQRPICRPQCTDDDYDVSSDEDDDDVTTVLWWRLYSDCNDDDDPKCNEEWLYDYCDDEEDDDYMTTAMTRMMMTKTTTIMTI